MTTIRVALADDHPVILNGLQVGLSQQGMAIVSQTHDCATLIDDYRNAEPDVLVLDIRFGGSESGLDKAKELLREFPNAKIVFYSQFDQNELILAAYKLSKGFVTKDSPLSVLVDAIRTAHEGRVYLMPSVATRLSMIAVHGDESPAAKLTPRELQVFKMMASGLTNIEIAKELALTPKTIGVEFQSIKEKLRIERQADCTKLAIKFRLMEV